MNIKSYSFYPIDAKMYLLVENHRAVILDPCVSEEAKEYLQSENVEEIIVLLTHEHYDHISGINWLRESFKRTKVICSEACGAALGKPHKNLSEYYEILFSGKDEKTQDYVKNMNIQPYSCEADEILTGRKNGILSRIKLLCRKHPDTQRGVFAF